MRDSHVHITAVVLLTAVLCSAGCQSLAPAASPGPVTAGAPAEPRRTHEQLQAVLWMQTAGEFWAVATSTYTFARRAIDAGLKDRKWTAALEQQGDFRRLPPAVILDLDETVLDNSRFQGRMIRENRTYDVDAWSSWVAAERAAGIPGAADFIRYAIDKKVQVFYVTNRAADQEEATIANLARMAITATPDSILSSGENGWASDKSSRRSFLAAKFRILALIGDDLNDFVSVATQSSEERLATTKANSARWGTQWFILPNPVYGSWDRTLYAGLTDDAAILAKKRSLVTGF